MPSTYIIVPQEGDTPGYLSHYDENGIAIGGPIDGFLGGFESWNITGSAVYDTNNPFDPIRFDPSRSNFVQVGDDGSFRIQIGTSINNINRSTSPHIEYGVAGTVDITLADNSIMTVPLDFAGVVPTGTRWAVYTDIYNNKQLAKVDASKTLAQLNERNVIYDRWASPSEVIAQAVAGRLIRGLTSREADTRDRYDRILEAMGITREEFENDKSGSVQGWVNVSQFNLEGASRHAFGPTGERIR